MHVFACHLASHPINSAARVCTQEKKKDTFEQLSCILLRYFAQDERLEYAPAKQQHHAHKR